MDNPAHALTDSPRYSAIKSVRLRPPWIDPRSYDRRTAEIAVELTAGPSSEYR
jgi:hypothetical protein